MNVFKSFAVFCVDKCPTGYDYQTGDVNGIGTLEHGVVATLEECGERCTRNLECNSFEHRARECNLNKELEPNSPTYRNFVFCSNNGKIRYTRSSVPCMLNPFELNTEFQRK